MNFHTYPLTTTQQRALSAAQSPEAPGHHVVVHRLVGEIDIDRWRDSVARLMRASAIFRRSFLPGDKGWLMVDGPEPIGELAVFDMRNIPGDQSFSLIDELVSRDIRPESAPLVRFSLVVEDDFAMLVMTAASFVIDRNSLRPLFRALTAAYAGHELTSIDLRQPELLELEKAAIASDGYESAVDFWLTIMKSRFEWQPAAWDDTDASVFWSTALPAQTTRRLEEVAAQFSMSLETLLNAAFHIFLSRLTDEPNTITSISGRFAPDSEEKVGFSTQRAFIPSHIELTTPLRDYLLDSKRLVDYALHNSHIPAREILAQMQLRDASNPRMTNVTFEWDALPYGELVIPGLTIELIPGLSRRLEISDIAVAITREHTLRMHVSVRNPWQAAAVRTSFEHYLALLENIPDSLDLTLGELSFFTSESRSAAMDIADRTDEIVHPEAALSRIRHMVETAPDSSALVCGDTSFTYAELWERIESVAAVVEPLIVGHDQPLVGICMTRSAGMIISLLGVIRAGAGYLPLDPANPVERLTFILGDAGASAVIVDEASREIASRAANATNIAPKVLVFNEISTTGRASTHDLRTQDPASTAYVIYTSGTTGTPKGVVISRHNLATFVAATEDVMPCGPGDRWFQFASLNFDASVLEIFNCLCRGATLVVVTSDVRTDPQEVWKLLHDQKISHAFIPPAMLRVLPRSPLPDLKDVYCGGEASDDATVAYWSNAVRLWNVYGPTETTVMCSANRLGALRGATNLGGPLPGYAMYVLDSAGDIAGTGGVGEIYIGGDAVAPGYLNRPELTEERFIPNPFGKGRIYRTGDLARRLPSGELEYLGRNDFQVKIRGFRIEIGDIEAAIRAVPGVSGVLVTVIKNAGGPMLGGWFTGSATVDTVRESITAILPHYMVPTHLVQLESFPVNISGKIDRTRLPMPGDDVAVSAEALTPLQRQVRDAWAEALKCAPESIGITSHFFHLGGHSLAAAVVCSRLSSALGINIRPKLLFEFPLLESFALQMDTNDPGEPLPEIARTESRTVPVTGSLVPMMWGRAVSAGADNTYTIVVRIDVDNGINPQVLRNALRSVLSSDPIFRSSLDEINGSLVIVEKSDIAINVPIIDCADTDAYVDSLRDHVFELSSAPLWRAEVLLGQSGSTIALAIHHAIFDGWSLNILLGEIGSTYEAMTTGSTVERHAFTFFDYAGVASELYESPVWYTAVNYWATKLKGTSAHIQLPTTSSTARADANAWHHVRITPSNVAALRKVADDLDTTLPPVLFATYLAWLWRISGQEDLTVSYPYAGRDIPGSDEIFGMFVTMGFLRETLDPKEEFGELVTRISKQMVADRDHLIASPYDIDLSSSGVPNVLFSLQSGIGLDGEFAGLPFHAHEFPSRTSKADIGGIFYETADGAIEGRIEYNSSLLDDDLIKDLLGTFTMLVQAAGTSPHLRVRDLPYLTDQDRSTVLAMATGAHLDEPYTTIIDRLLLTAETHPDRIALLGDGRTWTYTELIRDVDRLAGTILSVFQPQAQTPIGLSVRKSPELVIGALAILRAGCAYVPLDPHYPADRLAYLIENSGTRHIVADPDSAAVLSGTGATNVSFIDPFAPPAHTATELPAINTRQLAYVIYTSGSTGKPKGVMVEHRTVPRLIAGTANVVAFNEDSRIVLLGTLNFDASVIQVFLPLLTGGSLFIPPTDIEKNPDELHRVLDEARVTHAVVTPALVRNLPRKPLNHLQVLGFGGEAIDAASAEFWCQHTRFFSMYGPTETTVMSSLGEIKPGENSKILGKPLPGYTMHIVNPLRQLVPRGAIGEILIGGGGDARGYLGKPDLTMDRFIADPFADSPYARAYRSGDLGRFLADGTIEYFGRNDDQIKLRGFRIELGEIEAALHQVSGVAQAAAAIRGEGDLRAIVGYYTSEDGTALDEGAIRHELAGFLPEYMVPSFFVHLDSMPLNANGKLDRKALPVVQVTSESSEPPLPGLETQIAEVWEELLHFKGVGRKDDFFHLGGNSLLAARLQALLKDRLGLGLSLASLYANPTVAAIAEDQAEDSIAEAMKTVSAGLTVKSPAPVGAEIQEIRTVFLTGATGFLGIYLLKRLLDDVERVTCLVRAKDASAAKESLIRQAQSADLDIDFARVDVVLGDLGSHHLSIDDDTWIRLSNEIDAIIHCGAWVHHRYSYTTLKASNVNSTADLVELALTSRRKKFTFVSTESAAEALAGIDRVTETVESAMDHPPVSDVGYLLSKWVAEQLVADAVNRYDLEAVIARPGNITGDSRSGYSNFDHNHFWLYTKGCVQLGAYPLVSTRMEMTPVDIVAEEITALTLTSHDQLVVANLSNPNGVTSAELLGLISAAGGFGLKAEEPAVWQEKLATIDDSNSLFQLREFYEGDLSGESLLVDHDDTVRILAQAGVVAPADIEALVRLYVGHLKDVGFLHA